MNWMPDWILKLFGKKIADKLDLQEGAMDGTKPWYQSKTILAAVVVGLIGIYNSVATAKKLPPIPDWAFTILGAIGVYTRSTATDKITS